MLETYQIGRKDLRPLICQQEPREVIATTIFCIELRRELWVLSQHIYRSLWRLQNTIVVLHVFRWRMLLIESDLRFAGRHTWILFHILIDELPIILVALCCHHERRHDVVVAFRRHFDTGLHTNGLLHNHCGLTTAKCLSEIKAEFCSSLLSRLTSRDFCRIKYRLTPAA